MCFTTAKPSPVPLEPRTRSRPEEPLEETREILFGDPRPVVRDRQTAGGYGDGERAPGARVADRVLGEVLDDDPQHARSERQLNRRITLRPDGDAGAVGSLPNRASTSRKPPEGPASARRDDRPSRLQLAQEQDVVDELADVLDAPSHCSTSAAVSCPGSDAVSSRASRRARGVRSSCETAAMNRP